MATSTDNPSKNKYDNYLDERIAQTATQVKWVELLSFFLILAVFLLGALFLLCIVDAWLLELNVWMRWAALIIIGGGALVFAVVKAMPFLFHRVNPLYAAKKLEEGRPELKNSVINYLTTSRSTKKGLDRSIQEKLSARAATDVANIPMDVTVDRSTMIIAGYTLAGIVALFALYKVLSPKDPFQTIGRVVLPGANLMAPSRVKIKDITPGDQQKYFGEKLEVSASISGLGSGESARLLITSESGVQVDVARPMLREGDSDLFKIELGSERGLMESFAYRIEAGDAVSQSFQIEVRTCPTVFVEKVEYLPPAYTEIPPTTVEIPEKISNVENALATISVRANLPIETAFLKLYRPKPVKKTSEQSSESAGQKTASANPIGKVSLDELKVGKSIKLEVKDEYIATGQLLLELNAKRTGPRFSHYRVIFTAKDGSKSDEVGEERTIVSPLEVIPDLAPEIEVVKPDEKLVEIPQNQNFQIEVSSVDPDYGLTRVVWVAEHKGNRLAEKSIFKSADPQGIKGRQLGLFDFRPDQYGLKPGDEVLWYVEAEDNRTVGMEPTLLPNRTRTKNYKFVIKEPLGNSSQSNDSNQNQPDDSDPEQNPSPDSQPKSQKNKDSDPKKSDSRNSEGKKEGSKGEQNDKPNQQKDPNQEGEQKGSPSDQSKSGKQDGKQSGKQNGDQKGNPQKDPGSGSNNKEQSNQNAGQNQKAEPSKNQNPSSGNAKQDPQNKSSENKSSDNGKSGDPQKGGKSSGDSKQKDGSSSGANDPSHSDPQKDKSKPGDSSSGSSGKKESGSPEDNGEKANPNESTSSSDGTGTGKSSAEENPDKSNLSQSKPRNSKEAFERMKQYFDEKEKENGEPSGNSKNEGDDQPRENEDPSSKGSGGAEKNDPAKDHNKKGGSANDRNKTDKGEKKNSSQEQPGKQGAKKQESSKQESGKGTEKKGSQGPSKQDDGSKNKSSGNKSKTNKQQGKSSDQSPQKGNEKQSRKGEGDATDDASKKGQRDPSSKASDQKSSNNDPSKGNSHSGKSGEQKKPGAEKDGSQAKNSKKREDGNQKSDNRQADNANDRKSPKGAKESAENSTKSKGNEDDSGSSDRNQTKDRNDVANRGAEANDSNAKSGRRNPIDRPDTEVEKANLDYTKKATDLVLEKLADQKEKPDQELLKDLNWSEEELKEFTEKWQAMREKAQKGDVKDRARFEEALRSLGLKDPANRTQGAKLRNDDKSGYQQKSGTRKVPSDFARKFRAIQKSQQKLNNQ